MSSFFTVIIPTFNREYLIEETIRSVLKQTFKDFELIVVDNGSTDATRSIVENLASQDYRIHYHWQQNTGGPAGSRNTGIHLASGEYIAFLDDDDGWSLNKLERVATYINQLSRTERDRMVAVTHWEWEQNQSGENVRILRHGYPGIKNWHNKLVSQGNYFSPSAIVIKKGPLLSTKGFNPDLSLNTVEDYDLWIRLASLGEIHTIAEALGFWRNDGYGMTKNYELHIKNLWNLKQKHLNGNVPALKKARRHIQYLLCREHLKAKAYLKLVKAITGLAKI